MIKLIICSGINGEIGKSNKLLWGIPEDMKYFKEQTEGCVVVMGNNTSKGLPFKSGGLPNRENIILTHGKEDLQIYLSSNTSVQYVNNLEELKGNLLDVETKDVWIIGGASIYETFKDLVNEVHWTKVDKEFPEADTHFDMSWVKNVLQWEKVSVKELTDGVNVVVYRKLN